MEHFGEGLTTAVRRRGIHSMITRGAPIAATLEAMCRMVEEDHPDLRCSVLLLDHHEQTLSLVAGRSLPEEYRSSLVGVPVGDDIGTCSRAAYFNRPVLSDDLATDPHWAGWRELAMRNGVRACWSFPILDGESRVLGVFAFYASETRNLTHREHELAARLTLMMSLAIENGQGQDDLVETEQRFRSLFYNHPDAVISLDPAGTIRSVNAAATVNSGVAAEAMIGRNFMVLVEKSARREYARQFAQAMAGETTKFEASYLNAGGERRHVANTFVPISVGGRVEGVYGIVRDITEHKRHEAQLRVLERSVESSLNGVLIVDARLPDMPIVYTNPAFLKLTGYEEHEVMERNCRFLQGPETDSDTIEMIRRQLKRGRDVQVTLLNYRKDGSTFWNDLHISPVLDNASRLTHFIGVQHDVTEQKRNEDSLAFHATHDALTWLPVRSVLEQQLEMRYAESIDRGKMLAVLYLDIDNFKPINDMLGHVAGDKVLVELTNRLSAQLRGMDILSRFGGMSFWYCCRISTT